ncbi:MAG: ABC transporter ATP-binding protein [Opitutae bacterium]|jgi:lipopolysaccharide transport system ATP-binding protein|nr:ABC transporter ATP-binding protein [Opitutae bacterium]
MSTFRQAIKVNNLTKDFIISKGSGWARLHGAIIKKPNPKAEIFRALDGISFNIYEGETIGIIGPNGAGKSTLLQILAGTLKPTTGELNATGRIAAVLELGSGFNQDFTGRENARMYTATLGVPRHQIDKCIDEILEFAGIANFADQHLRTYSSGMVARLAFSCALYVDPEILLLDEVFAVGDQQFSRKSFKRIKEFIKKGKTVILCSHSPYHIQMVCDRTLYISGGKLCFFGETKEALVQYENDFEKMIPDIKTSVKERKSHIITHQENQYRFKKVTMFRNETVIETKSCKSIVFKSGIDSLSLKMELSFSETIPPPRLGVVIHDKHRRPITSAATHFNEFVFKPPIHGESKIIVVTFPRISLLKGEYEIDAFILCDEGFLILEHLTITPRIKIEQSSKEVGIVNIPHKWEELEN